LRREADQWRLVPKVFFLWESSSTCKGGTKQSRISSGERLRWAFSRFRRYQLHLNHQQWEAHHSCWMQTLAYSDQRHVFRIRLKSATIRIPGEDCKWFGLQRDGVDISKSNDYISLTNTVDSEISDCVFVLSHFSILIMMMTTKSVFWFYLLR
jgi:hypothetical protein